jgi:hypothetical protein
MIWRTSDIAALQQESVFQFGGMRVNDQLQRRARKIGIGCDTILRQTARASYPGPQKAFRFVTTPDMRRGAFRGDDHRDARVRLIARCSNLSRLREKCQAQRPQPLLCISATRHNQSLPKRKLPFASSDNIAQLIIA